MNPVFVTGGTGYVGRPLIESLFSRGHTVHALARAIYAILRSIPATREGAQRLGLMTRNAMTATLVKAIESPSTEKVRILGVPDIRRLSGEIG